MFKFINFSLLLILFTSGCRRFEQEKIIAKADAFVPQNLYPIERLPPKFNKAKGEIMPETPLTDCNSRIYCDSKKVKSRIFYSL